MFLVEATMERKHKSLGKIRDISVSDYGPFVYLFILLDWRFTSYSRIIFTTVGSLMLGRNREVPGANQRLTVDYCKTFPHTPGEEASMSWTLTHSHRIDEGLLSHLDGELTN